MPIPEEILAVARPKNSVVIRYGKNKDRYAVRKRVGCKRKNGKNYPVNGPTIGHIIDGKYVPIEEKGNESVSNSEIDIRDFGLVAECDKVFSYMIKELDAVYSKEDSLKLYCISLLRVMYPGIKDYELKQRYEESYLSVLYPNVGLSKNTVCTFLQNVGKAYSKIVKFMKNRVKKLGIKNHLVVDGTLKTNNSKINSLSDFSRKSRIKGSRDISIVYSFNLEIMEPVTAKCYPGNMLDYTTYSDFIEEFDIATGFLIGDKSFTRKAAGEFFKKHPDLHMLYPLKRNASQVKTYKMYDFENVLPGFEGITYKKVSYKTRDGRQYYLYSYRDAKRAAKEEQDWIERARKNKTYSYEAYEKKRKSFGTILLESDLDLEAEIAYKAYDYRWIIEIVMRYYKSSLQFTDTREHSDYSVIGSEFIDFLSVICTFRLLKDFDEHKLLNDKTYKQVFKTLKRAKKVRIEENGDWRDNRMNPSQVEMLRELELLPKLETKKRKRGRPKGSKNRKKKS